jgi:hypothetical protein
MKDSRKKEKESHIGSKEITENIIILIQPPTSLPRLVMGACNS